MLQCSLEKSVNLKPIRDETARSQDFCLESPLDSGILCCPFLSTYLILTSLSFSNPFLPSSLLAITHGKSLPPPLSLSLSASVCLSICLCLCLFVCSSLTLTIWPPICQDKHSKLKDIFHNTMAAPT